jgi:hypothetical protein
MTKKYFDSMHPTEKLKMIAEKAVFLLRKTKGCFRITLYQLDSFYVEVCFHATQVLFKRVRSFDDTKELEPYLEKIDISRLSTSF